LKKLVVNADDFGYREGINKGIIYAHQKGVVSSASLFVEREGSQEAVRLAKENPSLTLGIHLDLDKFFEIDHARGVVVSWLNGSVVSTEILKAEIRRQMDKFFAFGFTSDHIDSHHHSHLISDIFESVCQIAKEYKVPVVRLFKKFYSQESNFEQASKIANSYGLVFPDHFIEGWYWGNIDEDYTAAELMTHPGYGELWREAELAHCCQQQLKEYLANQKIELTNFSNLLPKKQ